MGRNPSKAGAVLYSFRVFSNGQPRSNLAIAIDAPLYHCVFTLLTNNSTPRCGRPYLKQREQIESGLPSQFYKVY